MCETTTPDNTNLEIQTGIPPRVNRGHRKWSGGEWVARLREVPSLADQCDWAALDGNDWRRLLKACPQFADYCNWSKLDGKNWHRLLSSQPQFADKCDWSKLNAEDWRGLLISQPLFIDKRSSLTLDEWCEWLCEHPRFIDHCPDGVWRRFGLGHWARLISTGGHAFAEKMMDVGATNRISDWCCPDHWAEEYHTLFTVQCAAATSHDEKVRRIAESSAINPNYDQVGGCRRVRYHDDMLKHIQWLASVAADCAQMAQQADESHAEQYALIAEAANYEIQRLTNHEIPTGISQDAFEKLRDSYCDLSSWAIWDKDDISNLEIFNESNRPWEKLRPQFVFVALNRSIEIDGLFSMFHSSSKGDHMLRRALEKTIFWGSYMTDIIDMVGREGQKTMAAFRSDRNFATQQIERFRAEIEDVVRFCHLVQKPLLIAMGDDTLKVLKWARDANLLNGYEEIKHITHYSYQRLSYDQYRQEIMELVNCVSHIQQQDATPDNTEPNGADTIAARHTSRCITNAESQSSRRSGTETDSILRNAVTAMSSFLNTSPDYRNNQVCLRKSNNGRLMLRFTSRNPSIRFNYEVKDKHAFAVQYGMALSDWGEKHGFQVNLGEGTVPGNGVQFIPNNNMDVANLDCDVLKKMGDSIVAKLRETIGE